MNEVIWYMAGWHVVLGEIMLGIVMLELFLILIELKELRKDE